MSYMPMDFDLIFVFAYLAWQLLTKWNLFIMMIQKMSIIFVQFGLGINELCALGLRFSWGIHMSANALSQLVLLGRAWRSVLKKMKTFVKWWCFSLWNIKRNYKITSQNIYVKNYIEWPKGQTRFLNQYIKQITRCWLISLFMLSQRFLLFCDNHESWRGLWWNIRPELFY